MNMKRLLTLVAFFATLHASAQQVNPVPDYVFANRMSAGRNTVTDTAAYFSIGPRYGATRGMMPPMVVDTASFSANKRNGLLIFSVQKNKFLYWDSVGVKWAEMAGTGGSAITGSGVAGYMPEFTTTTNLDTTRLYHSAGRFAIGSTTTSNGVFNVYGGQSYFDTSIKVASFFLADDKKGNVAIGIDSSDIAGSGWRSLTLQGTNKRSQIELSNSNTGVADVAGSIRGYNGANLIGSIDIQADSAIDKGRITFITNNGTTTARRLIVKNDGEILIGTDTDFGNYTLQTSGSSYTSTNGVFGIVSGGVGIGRSPTTSLDIYKATDSVNVLLTNNSGTNHAIVTLTSGATWRVQSNPTSGTNSYGFEIKDGSNTRLAINQGGESLFGTTSDAGAYQVQIAGALYNTTSAILAKSSGNLQVGPGTPTGSYIGYFDGNVGVSPVSGGVRYILTDATNTYTGALAIQAGRGSGTWGAGVVLYGHSHATYPGAVWVGRSDGSTGPIMFGSGGIGPVTEQLRIHSNGGLKFVPQSAAPTAEAGTVYYDSDDNKLKVYNGTTWVDLH